MELCSVDAGSPGAAARTTGTPLVPQSTGNYLWYPLSRNKQSNKKVERNEMVL